MKRQRYELGWDFWTAAGMVVSVAFLIVAAVDLLQAKSDSFIWFIGSVSFAAQTNAYRALNTLAESEGC